MAAAARHCASQVRYAQLNVTENETLYVDFVQRFNYSNSANGSISFIAPESQERNNYAQILVSDENLAETGATDKLYYSEKVRFPCASVCRLAHRVREHRMPRSEPHEIRLRHPRMML